MLFWLMGKHQEVRPPAAVNWSNWSAILVGYEGATLEKGNQSILGGGGGGVALCPSFWVRRSRLKQRQNRIQH